MRISPASTGFTLLLGFLVALPSFGIDMSLTALTTLSATFRVSRARVGLMMSLFMPLQQLGPDDPPSEYIPPQSISPMILKRMLHDVQADRANL